MKGRAYLDHASTSPPRPEAIEAMQRWLGAADPGRVHTEGRMARAVLEEARQQVAGLLGARAREVVFTSGATEAINAAVWGATAGDHGDGSGDGRSILCAAVEHSAVRDSSARAAPVIEVPVDRLGRIEVDAIRSSVRGGAALVHCQWANHEVGTVQPVQEIVELCRAAGVLVHVDAAAAAGHVPVDFDGLGADLLSVSGHKFGAPAGTGALLVRRGLRLPPFLVGGEQERARRGGLENVAALAGFGAAAAAISAVSSTDSARNRAQIARARAAALEVDGVAALGDQQPDDKRSVPHILCLAVAGVEAEAVLLGLDQAGIAAHSGSACSSESLEPSPVLEAMGADADRSLRVSVGWSTTDEDIERFASAFPEVVHGLRALRA